jgi:hypothetical protein
VIEEMHAPVTQIYVASQTLREMVVVAPPYTLLGTIFTICGVLALLVGFAVVLLARVGGSRPFQILMWLLPILVGGPFLALGLGLGAGTTRLTVSADTGTLSVRKTIFSVPVHSEQYPLTQVNSVKVGVGDVCRFLYVSLVDGRSETLLGCTDRTGYSEVAGSINDFLAANRK